MGIVVFADVDLMPDETEIDFSSHRLPPAPKLGTVGLWVGLHGESFLEAGMHHLEARFDYALLRDNWRAGRANHETVFELRVFAAGIHRGRTLARAAGARRNGSCRAA